MGEPAGIGGEITLKAWLARGGHLPPFAVIDDPDRLTSLARTLSLDVPIVTVSRGAEIGEAFARALPVIPVPGSPLPDTKPGQPALATAAAVVRSIDAAVALAKRGEVGAIVTNPINKKILQDDGFAYPGHTEYLGHLCGGAKAVMMLTIERADPPLRVVPVTVHVALRDIAACLTSEAIVAAAVATAGALKRDFGLAAPRLAVAALNPHAGEDGKMGDEEQRVVAPAVIAIRSAGIDVTGPLPADTLFYADARSRYDAVICMYHDQALVPLKTVDFAGGVNVTLGLPIVRTSPDHGTAFDIAGRGIADASSLIEAIKLAGRLGQARRGRPAG
ncbi:MAG: 4-hydroxythreonine-4-phosphate dehydrogenase PdxA [Rhodobacteraceae bacterium]|nr:4-hydroxythreonine-4-phosphate dehydrogenase PdxA [Paracoccaceae bacterium]